MRGAEESEPLLSTVEIERAMGQCRVRARRGALTALPGEETNTAGGSASGQNEERDEMKGG